MQALDLRDEELVAQLPGRGGTRLGHAVSAGGDEAHLGLPHHTADELGPETISTLIDEADHLDEGRPSSVAKNTDASRSTWFAFSSSAMRFFNCLTSASIAA